MYFWIKKQSTMFDGWGGSGLHSTQRQITEEYLIPGISGYHEHFEHFYQIWLHICFFPYHLTGVSCKLFYCQFRVIFCTGTCTPNIKILWKLFQSHLNCSLSIHVMSNLGISFQRINPYGQKSDSIFRGVNTD